MADEVFSLVDAVQLRTWATSKKIGGLTMWSINR